MKKKLNEAEYNLSITDLNTNDGDTLSQIIAMANQADNGSTEMPVATEPAPVDPYEDGLEGNVAVDTPFDTVEEPVDDFSSVEEDPTIDDMGYGVPVDGDPFGSDDEDPMAGINLDDYADYGIDENDFNQEEPYTFQLPDEESILTEESASHGYSIMVKDKEYAHIDTDKEYSDDEIITEFLKQYMEKKGKEFPYIDQIVVVRNNGVDEDVLLPKDDMSGDDFIPEDEEFSDEMLEEEINQILWSAGVEGCSDKEEKGVNKDSLLEDDEDPEMNLEDCDAPNPAEMNLDDNEEIDESADSEWKTVRKNAMANPNLYGGRYTDKDSRKAKKEFLKDKEANKKKDLKEAGEGSKGLRVPVRFEFDGYIDVRTNSEEEAIQLITDNCWAHLGDVATNMREEIANYNINTNGYPRILDDEPIEEVEVDELEESAFSPKIKDPNRKAPTQPYYKDVNTNADAKSASLGFEYPAPTNGKISLSPKAGKIMESAKHLLSKQFDATKKEKLQSRFVFKLMNEGVSFSDAKRIISKF